jgi:hypothetical protein
LAEQSVVEQGLAEQSVVEQGLAEQSVVEQGVVGQGLAEQGLARSVPEPRSGTPAHAAPVPQVPAQGQGPDAAGPRPGRAGAPDIEYVWDVEAIDSAGQSLVTWRGLRLADAGPLPRAASWPPSLLSVYLERSAVALGLHPGIRVTAGCGQPESTGPQPAVVVPAPRHAAGKRPDTGERRPAEPGDPAGEQADHGRGLLDGFVLSVRSPQGAACGWEAAVPGPAHGPEPGPGLAGVETLLRTGRGEPPAIVEAMLRAVAGCLTMAGAPEAVPVAVPGPPTGADRIADGGWLLLRAGGATLACTVADISGVPSPVAIAVMTGDPAQRDEPRTGAEPRARQAGKAGTATAQALAEAALTTQAPPGETDAAESPATSTAGRTRTARGSGAHARRAGPDA